MQISRDFKVVIIAVGTEVCAGDIANTNGAWLAKELTACGLRVVRHIVVEDDRAEITKAITQAAADAAHVFMIGGLGPTSDDFTRDLITEWAGDSLVFAAESWTRIQERFAALGRPVPESNRQQCWFPQRAHLYRNRNGTADAFSVSNHGTTIYALPGPPNEAKGIWNDYLKEVFTRLIPAADRRRLRVWQCLGQGESFLAEITENCLKGCGLEIGYRARFPYVDIKVWHGNETPALHQYLANLENALAPWLVGRDDFDLIRSFADKCRDFKKVIIDDRLSGGALAERLARPLWQAGVHSVFHQSEGESSYALNKLGPDSKSRMDSQDILTFHLTPLSGPGQWRTSAQVGIPNTATADSPTAITYDGASHLKSTEWTVRNQTYVAECAILQWWRWLENSNALKRAP